MVARVDRRAGRAIVPGLTGESFMRAVIMLGGLLMLAACGGGGTTGTN